MKNNKKFKKLLVKRGFTLIPRDGSPFVDRYFLSYYVKNRFILFFNENDKYGKFLMAYSESLMGKYDVVPFRWTDNIEEVEKLYKAVTNIDL